MTDSPTTQPSSEIEPREALLQIVNGYMISQCVYAVAKLGIADLLRDGPKGCDELAASANVHASSLHRVLRCLAGFGVFAENEDGRFALTPMAEQLRTDVPGSVRSWSIMRGEQFCWRPWGEILHSVRTGESAFIHAFGMDWPDYFSRNPEESVHFDNAMRSISAVKYQAVADAYDFSGVKTVVDVGGGNGGLITAILKANARLTGILSDLPHVLDGARKSIDTAGLTNRCRCVGIDMFERVPSGGDAYIMANVICDWDDWRSITILQNCRRAMQESGRVLLVEMLLAARNQPHLSKLHDVEMLVMTDGGKGRSENEYRSLYEAAGLRLTRVLPTKSPWSVIEGFAA